MGDALSKKTIFSPFGPQYCLKIRGGGRAPLDPSLRKVTKAFNFYYHRFISLFTESFKNGKIQLKLFHVEGVTKADYSLRLIF